MKEHIRLLITITASLLFTQLSWAYEEGWNHKNFYEEVGWCKESIVYPSAQDYIKVGLADNKSEETLRLEAISMTPVFDKIGSDMCYCAFNQLAQDIPHSNYNRDMALKNYSSLPQCRKLMKEAMFSFSKDPKKNVLDHPVHNQNEHCRALKLC